MKIDFSTNLNPFNFTFLFIYSKIFFTMLDDSNKIVIIVVISLRVDIMVVLKLRGINFGSLSLNMILYMTLCVTTNELRTEVAKGSGNVQGTWHNDSGVWIFWLLKC